VSRSGKCNVYPWVPARCLW